MTTQNTPMIPEAQRGPAERLLDLVLSGSAHLWHNRPGHERERHVAAGAPRQGIAAQRCRR